MKKRLFYAAALTASAAFLLGLILSPETAAEAVREGLQLCLSTLIPALFPFFLAGGVLVRLGLADRLGRLLAPVTRRLFGLPGAAAAALSLGLLGGYPGGARTVRSLYDRGSLTKPEAERLLGFCNNAGPGFFLGLVGPLLGSARLGALLFGIHALSALLLGLIFRGRAAAQPQRSLPGGEEPFSQALPRAAEDALRSLGRVCAMVLLLHCAAALAGVSAPAALGLLEVGSGVLALRGSSAPMILQAVLCSFLLGFGGLSVHAQTAAELRGSGLSLRRHTAGKLLHGLLAAGLTGASLRLFPASAVPAFAPYSPVLWHLLPYEMAMEMITASIKLDVFLLFLLLLPIFVLWLKNCWKNRGQSDKLRDGTDLKGESDNGHAVFR